MNALLDVAFGQFRKIEPGGKVWPLAMQNNGADAIGNVGDDRVEFGDGGIVQRVALVLAIKRDDQHLAALLRAKGAGLFGGYGHGGVRVRVEVIVV